MATKKVTTKEKEAKTPAKKAVVKKKAPAAVKEEKVDKSLSASGGKEEKVEKTPKATTSERYVYAVGRRKTAVAQVRLYKTSQAEGVVVNKRPIREYFGTLALETAALLPLVSSGLADSFRVTVVVRGGGLHGQAGAIKLGVARALLKHDAALRPTLKALGFLTRDARAVERKKPGLKKARRAPQWSKR